MTAHARAQADLQIMFSNPRQKYFFGLVLRLLPGAFTIRTNTATALSRDDKAVARQTRFAKGPAPKDFAAQVPLIGEILAAISASSPGTKPVPSNETCEPKNLLANGGELYYDRSRLIDKSLEFIGFRTHRSDLRHLDGESFLRASTTYRRPSHTITEGMTSRGWMVVDSLRKYIAIDPGGNSVSARDLPGRINEPPGVLKFYKAPYVPI